MATAMPAYRRGRSAEIVDLAWQYSMTSTTIEHMWQLGLRLRVPIQYQRRACIFGLGERRFGIEYHKMALQGMRSFRRTSIMHWQNIRKSNHENVVECWHAKKKSWRELSSQLHVNISCRSHLTLSPAGACGFDTVGDTCSAALQNVTRTQRVLFDRALLRS